MGQDQTDQFTIEQLAEIFDTTPEALAQILSNPALKEPREYLCGACHRGDHADCSGWCYCPLGCKNN